LVKAGIGYWRISPFERRVLEAAAAAALATGVSVMVHLEYGSAAFEVLDALAQSGLSADRVALAHLDRNLDPGLHAELTRAGAYIGYDGMARHRRSPDSALLDCLEATLGSGGDPERILVGADVARRSRFRAYGGLPGLAYLPERFWPRLERRVGAGIGHGIQVTNPARWLALATAPPGTCAG
jgi:phosphotriesterase-related protein